MKVFQLVASVMQKQAEPWQRSLLQVKLVAAGFQHNTVLKHLHICFDLINHWDLLL